MASRARNNIALSPLLDLKTKSREIECCYEAVSILEE
jgi:hypothetical protein